MRVQQGKWSRRSFLKTTAAGVAAAGVVGNFARIAEAADGLRSIGLGVSEINEIQDKATKELGFSVSGQAMGYGDMFSKMLNQNDQYEIAEGYYNDMDVMLPAKVWQPIDTKKIKDWDKVTNLTKTGQADARIEHRTRRRALPDPVGRRARRQGEGTVAVHQHVPGVPQCQLHRLQPESDRHVRSKAGASSSTRISRARSPCSTCRRSA